MEGGNYTNIVKKTIRENPFIIYEITQGKSPNDLKELIMNNLGLPKLKTHKYYTSFIHLKTLLGHRVHINYNHVSGYRITSINLRIDDKLYE